jgi:hypothetical protein
VTQVLKASDFLAKCEALWPGAEVTLRSGRVARVINEYDAYLKKRGVTATPGENREEDIKGAEVDDVDDAM